MKNKFCRIKAELVFLIVNFNRKMKKGGRLIKINMIKCKVAQKMDIIN